MTDQIDRIDLRIISALSGDARLPMSALAQKVGLSKTPVQARVRKLEATGIIKGYTVRTDHLKLGRGHIAFVQVRLSNTRAEALNAFNAAVQSIAEIEECHMTAASFDYLLKIRTSDISHYRRVLGETIAALPHVSVTSTFVVMEAVKEN